jgi:ABC-type Na+ transport system ATPase subunit NatA
LNKKIFKTSGYDIETSKNGQTIMKKDKNSNTKVIVSASALRYINFFKKIISGIKTKISI